VFSNRKTRMTGLYIICLRNVMIRCFDTILERDRQTYGRAELLYKYCAVLTYDNDKLVLRINNNNTVHVHEQH